MDRLPWVRAEVTPLVRRIVKALLRKGIEPEPKYFTGKFWID